MGRDAAHFDRSARRQQGWWDIMIKDMRLSCRLLPAVLGRKLARDANPSTVLSQVSRIRIQLNLRRLVAGLV